MSFENPTPVQEDPEATTADTSALTERAEELSRTYTNSTLIPGQEGVSTFSSPGDIPKYEKKLKELREVKDVMKEAAKGDESMLSEEINKEIGVAAYDLAPRAVEPTITRYKEQPPEVKAEHVESSPQEAASETYTRSDLESLAQAVDEHAIEKVEKYKNKEKPVTDREKLTKRIQQNWNSQDFSSFHDPAQAFVRSPEVKKKPGALKRFWSWLFNIDINSVPYN